MQTLFQAELAIIGGGIAGLWMQAAWSVRGRSSLLIVRDPKPGNGLSAPSHSTNLGRPSGGGLGDGQTIWSQGIIHGGLKYALGGEATRASQAIAEMPGRWLAALEGRGEVDLRGLRPFADRQHLWTTGGVLARLAGLAASKAIRTPVERVEPAERPEALRGAGAGVDVYSVGEPVLPVRGLVRALAEPLGDSMLAADEVVAIRSDADGVEVEIVCAGRTAVIRARRLVLCAGAGNPGLLAMAGLSEARGSSVSEMQRRPLHMVVARGPLPMLNGHALGASSKPRLTITTAMGDQAGPGERTWLIGGEIAEAGVARDEAAQIAEARRELAACLPWVSLAGVRFATGRIDRAEARTADGQKPDVPVVRRFGPVVVAWPTKLAFAPLLTDQVEAELVASGLAMSAGGGRESMGWPVPRVASYPWDREGTAWR
jgi:glycerol-3-phosphate dehydrogenase